MIINEFDLATQHTSGITYRNQDPPNSFHEHSHHLVVLNQEDLLSQIFKPYEKVSNVIDSIKVARKMHNIMSPSKKVSRENYKIFAQRKQLVIVHRQVNASTLISFLAKAHQDQLIKKRGKRRKLRKKNVGNERSLHSIFDIWISTKGLYHRSIFLDIVDRIIKWLKQLELTEKAKGNSDLVPYVQNGDIVPYEGPFDLLKNEIIQHKSIQMMRLIGYLDF